MVDIHIQKAPTSIDIFIDMDCAIFIKLVECPPIIKVPSDEKLDPC